MNLRSLNSATMAALSSAWVEEQKDLFLSVQEIAGLWPQIKDNYDDLMAIQEALRKQQAIKELNEEIAKTDRRYDAELRVIWYALEAHVEWAFARERVDQAARLEKLRATLLPEGLSWVTRTYLEEAGNATRVVAQLQPAERALLESIPVGDGSLLDVLTRWSKEGALLADQVRRRDILLEADEKTPDDYETRLNWVRLVSAMMTLLDLTTAPQEVVAALKQPVVAAVEGATQSSGATTSEEAGGEADTESSDAVSGADQPETSEETP